MYVDMRISGNEISFSKVRVSYIFLIREILKNNHLFLFIFNFSYPGRVVLGDLILSNYVDFMHLVKYVSFHVCT